MNSHLDNTHYAYNGSLNNIKPSTTYEMYNANLPTNNKNTRPTKTKRRRPNIRFRGKNIREDSLFTRGELIDLINKSIYFLYKMKDTSLPKKNRRGKLIPPLNLTPFYERLIMRLPIINNARQHNRVVPIIKFQYDNVYECDSYGSCIDDDAIDFMEIKCGVLNGIEIAYIMYNGNHMSAIAKEPTFMNSLNEKETAFMKMIFDNSNVLTDEGFRLNEFEAENIGEQLNAIANKNRTARLRFSNKVHVKEIPNRKTMRQIIHYWNK
jgi:hypothetical protein